MSYHQTNETFQDILRRQWARRGVKIALSLAVAILVLLIGTCIALPSTTPAAAPGGGRPAHTAPGADAGGPHTDPGGGNRYADFPPAARAE